MRITQNTLFNNLNQQIQTNTQQLLVAQEQVATQKKINSLSDDPVDAGRVISLNTSIAQSNQYLSNISSVSATSNILDSTYDQANTILSSVKTLLLQETNEATSTTVTRQAASAQVATLTSQMVGLANTQYNGNYIFSGFKTQTPAFTQAGVNVTPGAVTGGETVTGQQVADVTQMTYDNYQIKFTAPNQFNVVDTTSGATLLSNQTYTSGSAIQFDGMDITLSNTAGAPQAGDTFNVATSQPGQYQGDSNTQFVEIQAGTKVPANTPGNQVFQGTGVTGGVDVFGILNQINTALHNDDQTQMSALLDQVDQAQAQLSNARSVNGAQTNLLTDVQSNQTDMQTSLQELSSNLEDVDVATAATQLQNQQNSYSATLAAASKIIQPSLLDFLQ